MATETLEKPVETPEERAAKLDYEAKLRELERVVAIAQSKSVLPKQDPDWIDHVNGIIGKEDDEAFARAMRYAAEWRKADIEEDR